MEYSIFTWLRLAWRGTSRGDRREWFTLHLIVLYRVPARFDRGSMPGARRKWLVARLGGFSCRKPIPALMRISRVAAVSLKARYSPCTGFSAGPLSIGTQMVTGRRGDQRLVATSKPRAYPLLPGGHGAAEGVST